ncbi:MAG: hypothetical protein AAGL69_16440 [Pseudomonadota bacterium]
MPTFDENIAAIQQARDVVDRAQSRVYMARLAAQRARGDDLDDGALASALRGPTAQLDRANARLNDAVNRLHTARDYRRIAKNLDAEFPLVMLPVRLETRFVDDQSGQVLLVRVYPDDFHVHSFEPLLTDDEVSAGQDYWRALLRINRLNPDEPDVSKQEIWNMFARRLGRARAVWVAKQTTPANWRPNSRFSEDRLRFPDQDETKTHDWTRAPQTQILPDRFVLQIYNNGQQVHHTVGKPVPDNVFLGPDPFLAEKAFQETEQRIELDESFAWMSDFDAAVDKGLAFRIPVTPDMLNGGRIERLVVCGVLASADPAKSQSLLEAHLHAHQYSTKGLSFLSLGTPTNNTDTSASGYRRNDFELPNGYYDASPVESLSNQSDTDGHAFATALGINPDGFSETRDADMTQVADARAMNDALYPATVGYFFEVLTRPALSRIAQDRLREFFRENVSSSGPVPSIRVGDQPYGVLVTSDLSRWTEPNDDPLMSQMLPILRLLQSTWSRMADEKVAYVAKPGDAEEILLDIMGLSPHSTSFRQRSGHLNDVPLSATNVSNSTRAFQRQQNTIMSWLAQAGYQGQGFPLISALSFYRDNDRIRRRHLVDRKRVSADRFLDDLGSAPQNFIEWLSTETSTDALEQHKLPGAKPPRSVLYFLLRHALLLSLQKAAVSFYRREGVEISRLTAEKSLLNFDRDVRDLTTWELLRGAPRTVDRRRFNVRIPVGDHLLGMRRNASAVAELNLVRQAARRLAGLSTEALERHLIGHLDLTSYRLDAWHTGVFTRRLFRNRQQKGRGLYLGAYGWLENIRPAPKAEVRVAEELTPPSGGSVQELRGNAGFVHTPSLNHATAAGVLLAGYRNRASRDKPSVFSVNLSSARVRRAQSLMSGIQNGQALEALLGYQFERALHDRTSATPTVNLNRHILTLRERFPIEHVGIAQAGSEAQETVPAYSVVDGMKLVESDESDLRQLSIPAPDRQAIEEEIDQLRDVLDAMGDLLTSDAAFQMVQGKGDRLAGLLNSFNEASLPPQLEVQETPRSTQLTVNNTVCLAMTRVAALEADMGWSSRATPRTRAEPGINRWLGHQLGRADRIVASVAIADGDERRRRQKFSLADLNLQPIDLVYTAGIDIETGARSLEPALVNAYTAEVDVADDDRIVVEFDTSQKSARERTVAEVLPLLRYLRLMITTAKPASARDFRPRSQTVDENPDALFGWDVATFDRRVGALIRQFDAALNRLESRAPNGIRPRSVDNPATLGEAFAEFEARGRDRTYFEAMALAPRAASQIRSALASLPLFGMRAPRLDTIDTTSAAARGDLLSAAATAWREARKRYSVAVAKRAEAANSEISPDLQVARLIDAGRSVLGDDFVLLPEFRLGNASDIRRSLEEGSSQLLNHYATTYETTPALAIENWLQSLTPVRPAIHRLETIRMITEFNGGQSVSFDAVQLPYREGDSWLSVEFPAEDPDTGEPFSIKDDTLSLCISGLDAARVGGRQRMLKLDHWTESIPMPSEVTGVAFNYNQPNASAPNAILVAVEPSGGEHWSWDALTGTLTDTMDRARTRAVEPAQILEEGSLDVLLPMTIASFDLNESNLSLDYLATNDELVARLRSQYQLYQGLD